MATNNGRAIFGVLAIVIGAAIYYCNSRINRLEESLQKQNQVLSSFITNIHNTIGGSQSLSTPEADAAAKQYIRQREDMEQAHNNNNQCDAGGVCPQKIDVSDDGSDDSDGADDSDDDSADDSDGADDSDSEVSVTSCEESNRELHGGGDNRLIELTEHGDSLPLETNDFELNMKSLNVEDFIISGLKTVELTEDICPISDDSSNDSSSDDTSSDEGDNAQEIVSDIVQDIVSDIVQDIAPPMTQESIEVAAAAATLIDISHVNMATKLSYEESGLNKLRVSDLRKIANENMLSSSSKINSSRKQELVNLIMGNSKE